uniref:F-box domain-containing protein n=1 Tax=Ditylenchus dipsaci TaxID=166011 RepID=A0A915DB58_9BILA
MPAEIWNDIVSYLSLAKCYELVSTSRRITPFLRARIGAILKQVQEMSPIEKLLQLQHVDFYEKRFVMSSIIKNLSKEEVQSVMDDGRWGELDLKLQANLEYHQDLLE